MIAAAPTALANIFQLLLIVVSSDQRGNRHHVATVDSKPPGVSRVGFVRVLLCGVIGAAKRSADQDDI
ncbi:hypothetical protein HMPREF0004_5664 [Achromobacter piechaudii ATCC 43553]|uniref:Uncharacterized protein n=1 Tax=Achromobacter piechaudii ATCC 43553 TaxID=742159 RepID=D4XJL7_9BURK|nr:hypothetical protein HMPREF0004_5664 [Achromobacter piechaudii ATCC 43553]